jgi:FMN phosphatase YigB (HAD superfamily)
VTPIRWIFMDVGNILLDEDPLTYFVFRRHVEAVRRACPDCSFAQLLAVWEARALAGSPWPLFEVVSAELDPGQVAETWESADREARARFAELSPAVPGSGPLVERLGDRFLLGLIANHPRECRARLAELGLLEQFAVVALGEEEGLAKPDASLFRRALERAGVEPSECLMVGDRLAHDIAPAAGLGMATAWVRWPRREAKGWHPRDPEPLAYLRALERIAAFTNAPRETVRPTLAVDEVAQLASAIDEWLAQGGSPPSPIPGS